MPVFLVHDFNHSTRVFKFVFDHYGFTSMSSNSNSSSMKFEYVMSSDSSLHVHMGLSHALLEQ